MDSTLKGHKKTNKTKITSKSIRKIKKSAKINYSLSQKYITLQTIINQISPK